jgi:hypothetical protein
VERIARWTLLVGLAVAAVVTPACSSDDSAQSSPDPNQTTLPSLPETTIIEEHGTTTVVEAPITFPPDADAEQVVAELGPRLPMSELERACVVATLGADGDLLGRLGDGVATDTDLFDELVDMLRRCTVTTTQAPMFAESVNQSVDGTLTPDQLTCLTDGFAGLSMEELDTVLASVSPSDPSSATGIATVAGLVTGCGVEVPSP